jgi:hypothetical protein
MDDGRKVVIGDVRKVLSMRQEKSYTGWKKSLIDEARKISSRM